ncbi:hypothetical protein ACFW04_013815 [Cataglyphis niger]
MFSRAAKSVVKPFTSCRIHGGKNFKVASEISQILSKQSKNSTKVNALPLYDEAVVNKPLSNFNEIYIFNENQLSESLMKKSSSAAGNQPNALKINDNINLKLFNHQEDNVRSQIEKLVETLYRLPIAEEVAALNKPLISSANIILKLQTKQESLPGKLRESGTNKAVTSKKLRLGESDCGKNSNTIKRNPCDPPKGPCRPSEPPGYPSKPKPKRKPFCVKCPPKKPCKNDKCAE